MGYYYEWISKKTGVRQRVSANPYLPVNFPDRFKVDFQENHIDNYDYHGESVALTFGDKFVELVA